MAWCTRRGPDAVFFSSRRRHTRYWRDGVQTCALPIWIRALTGGRAGDADETSPRELSPVLLAGGCGVGGMLTVCGRRGRGPTGGPDEGMQGVEVGGERSEERRVGKEGRSRGSPYL